MKNLSQTEQSFVNEIVEKIGKYGKITELVVENRWICTGNIYLNGIQYPLLVFRYENWIEFRMPLKILKLGLLTGIFCVLDSIDGSVSLLPLNDLYAIIDSDVDESRSEFTMNFWRLDEINKICKLYFKIEDKHFSVWKQHAVEKITDCVRGSNYCAATVELNELLEPVSQLKRSYRKSRQYKEVVKSDGNYYVELLPWYIVLSEYLTKPMIYVLHRFRIRFVIYRLEKIKALFYFSKLLDDFSVFSNSGISVDVYADLNTAEIVRVFDSDLGRFLTTDEIEYQKKMQFTKNKNWGWLY